VKRYELAEWALEAPVDRPLDRLVLGAYVLLRNRETGLAFAGMETLVRMTMLDRKTILAARQRLVTRGHLVELGRTGRNGVTKYRLGPENGTSTDPTGKSRKRDDDGRDEVPLLPDGDPENGTCVMQPGVLEPEKSSSAPAREEGTEMQKSSVSDVLALCAKYRVSNASMENRLIRTWTKLATVDQIERALIRIQSKPNRDPASWIPAKFANKVLHEDILPNDAQASREKQRERERADARYAETQTYLAEQRTHSPRARRKAAIPGFDSVAAFSAAHGLKIQEIPEHPAYGAAACPGDSSAWCQRPDVQAHIPAIRAHVQTTTSST
jgi:hypothetical protein